MSRDIVHAIDIEAEPKKAFDTIATRSGLASFWTPDVQGEDAEGGELTFGFSEAPVRLPIRVARVAPGSTITWDCLGGFPYWEGTTVTWSLRPFENGTKLVFSHTGFPDDEPDEDFGSVSLTWASVVMRLKDVVESGGAANPALS